MHTKTMLVCALACNVAMSAVFGPFCASICRGDVNGDHRVNIFDAQTLVAQMLAGAMPASEVDVNRDGQVDVRDLQFILARLNTQTSSEEPVPSDKKTPRAIIVAAERFWMRADTGAIEILRPSTEETKASLRFHDEPLVVLSPHTERYLFTLTANAPPFLA